jgi:hypothetical protein
MKQLLTIGDSFTQGAEVTADQAWATLLANRLGYQLTNLGRGSGSNDYIFRTTVEQLAVHDWDLVIIGWTDHHRMEYTDEYGSWNLWPGIEQLVRERFHPGPDYRQQLVDWISRHHDSAWLQQRWMAQVVALQALLQQHNTPWLMCRAFNAVELQGHAVENLIDSDRFLGWPTQTMKHWAGECEYGVYGHFLALGHERVADKIYEHIRP